MANHEITASVAHRLAARDFAIKAHDNQRYGDLPYAVHLDAVGSMLVTFGAPGRLIAPGYLHDVPEDCEEHWRFAMEQRFPEDAKIANACAARGGTRRERNAIIARQIDGWPDAQTVKAADRAANITACILTGDTRRMAMYAGERDTFLRATPLAHLPLREHLIALHAGIAYACR